MLNKLLKLNITLIVLLLLLLSTQVTAQVSDRKNNIQVYASGLSYKGELGSQYWDEYGLGGGISYNRYLSPSFDIGMNLSYGKSEFDHEDTDFFKNKIGMGVLALRLKMYGTILDENAIIGPYLTIGAAGMYVRSEGVSKELAFNDKFFTPALVTGAGLRFRVTQSVSVFSEVNHLLTGSDKFDGQVASDNDSFLEYKLGLGLIIGKGKDQDEDGVPDRKDKCSNTPAGIQVDKSGCPIDTDGDGVADYQDQCPTEAGVAKLGGCPDKDGDGVADKEDQCPDEAGSAAAQGCPDADGDGVNNNIDKCPDTPAGVQVSADGCSMDTDGDGVPDNEDLCPNSAGTAETKGCPVIDAKTLQLLEEKARFEFDQASVQEVYKNLLDSIIIALAKYPDHVLTVTGHADHIGSEEYNQILSEQRAQAVKNYLIERGVQNPDRIVVQGFGETQPLVKVDTRLSKERTEKERALNRRVGFELDTPELKLNME